MKAMRLETVLLALVTTFVISACGGGGNDKPDEDLELVAVSGSFGSDRPVTTAHSSFFLRFNVPLDANTVTDDSVSLVSQLGNSTIPTRTELAGSHTIEVFLNRPLLSGVSYVIQVLSHLRGADREILSSVNDFAIFTVQPAIIIIGDDSPATDLHFSLGTNNLIYRVKADDSGNIFTLSNSGSGNARDTISRFDRDGVHKWSKIVGDGGSNFGYAIDYEPYGADVVYAAWVSEIGDPALICLDALSGDVLWNVSVPFAQSQPIVIASGSQGIYIGLHSETRDDVILVSHSGDIGPYITLPPGSKIESIIPGSSSVVVAGINDRGHLNVFSLSANLLNSNWVYDSAAHSPIRFLHLGGLIPTSYGFSAAAVADDGNVYGLSLNNTGNERAPHKDLGVIDGLSGLYLDDTGGIFGYQYDDFGSRSSFYKFELDGNGGLSYNDTLSWILDDRIVKDVAYFGGKVFIADGTSGLWVCDALTGVPITY